MARKAGAMRRSQQDPADNFFARIHRGRHGGQGEFVISGRLYLQTQRGRMRRVDEAPA